ncbi:hypothetical protein DENSPDRAFT_692792 [Dentipellis sp. KUC8613]|nr:hypothetical protein DENSPDRAFT_692792 [Dentipellis sp. KUC8613]
MPPRVGNDTEPPKKRAKLDVSSRVSHKFSSAGEIRGSLQNQSPESLAEVLTSLRNQFTIRASEGPISPQDERLALAKSWMEVAPGAQELFEIWEGTNQRQSSLHALVVSVLASLLNILSTQFTFQAYGQAILKTLLSTKWMNQLNSYLGGSHNDLIMSTLKLLNAMSAFAGGRERKAVFEAFAWETKSLPKLLSMRRKGKNNNSANMLSIPDIRTLYILFILSFVDTTTPSSIKAAFLEQRKDVFLSIFKGLIQDPYAVARKILETCWAGIWSDPKVKRTLKVNVFNEATISQIIKLYERSLPESEDSEQVPADLIHHFLLAICTRPGVGICFKDRGWYPRETDEDSTVVAEEVDVRSSKNGRIYNKILANILRGLKVNEDARQQELALKILAACPELVAGYWSAAALTLEPRLSSKWIANVSFFGTVLSLPIPESSFLLPNSSLYQPTPPPLSTVLENVLPSVNTKVHFSRGLQSTSHLVQHCSALALAKCLMKYAAVLEFFRKVEAALEENEGGQWSKRRQELEREVRRRVPDFQVVVALSQNKAGENPSAKTNAALSVPVAPNHTQAALLAESSTRLLWLYHRCLPQLVAEARFDVGKLLQNFMDNSGSTEGDAVAGLHTLRQLHILRLLRESDQFSWSSKTGSHSHLYILLHSYVSTETTAIRNETEALLKRVLSESVLFQHDADEVYLWLSAVHPLCRPTQNEAPDGAPLTDEGNAVITFLDDCIQRCLKTPYKYIEGLQALVPEDDTAVQESDNHPSPVIMTLLEQLNAKIAGRLLSASDALAVASFLRRLLVKLAGKELDLRFLRACADRFTAAVAREKLFEDYHVMSAAILHEAAIADASLRRLAGLDVAPPTHTVEESAVKAFILQVVELPLPEEPLERRTAASELVDWIRLADAHLEVDDVLRLLAVLDRFDRPTIEQFMMYLDPREGLLSDPKLVAARPTLYSDVSFDYLFAHCSTKQLADPALREMLANSVCTGKRSVLQSKAAVNLLAHRLASPSTPPSSKRDILSLAAEIIHSASLEITGPNLASLKEHVFSLPAVKELCSSSALQSAELEGLETLLRASVDPTKAEERKVVAEFASHWAASAKFCIDSGETEKADRVVYWVRYMELTELLDLFDHIIAAQVMTDRNLQGLVSGILDAIEQHADVSDIGDALRPRLPSLLDFCAVYPNLPTLQNLAKLAVDACLPLCLDGVPPAVAFADSPAISYFVAQARRRWSQRLAAGAGLDPTAFLSQSPWSSHTLGIVKGLVYLSAEARRACGRYLTSSAAAAHKVSDVAPLLHSFLDAIQFDDDLPCDFGHDIWDKLFSNLIREVLDRDASVRHRSLCGDCVIGLIRHCVSKRSHLLTLISHVVQKLSLDLVTEEILVIGRRLLDFEEARTNAEVILDHGLQWAARHFSGGDTDGSEVVHALGDLAKAFSKPKAHLVETIVVAVVQSRLSDVPALTLVNDLIPMTSLKPLVVNRHLQGIVQHGHFFKLAAASSPARDSIINLLCTLFHQHPSNTCQPSHIQPLLQVYTGSLSISDRKILSIFQLFEETRKTSVASLLGQWSLSPGVPSADAREAVQSLDTNQVFRSCMAFSWRRTTEGLDEDTTIPGLDSQLYDPVFIALLTAQMLADCPPSSALEWVQFFRTNVVSLLLRSLSSKDDMLRDISLTLIVSIQKLLENADMQEKPHVLYMLHLVKNALSEVPHDDAAPRLPSYTTLLLAHALRAVFYPSNFIYPLTARFLLQRPELDISDIPMLYGMLYSSSDDWKKERGWILKFMSDAMLGAGAAEWKIFKRRHTWDLLASIWQSAATDRVLRNGVLEVLVNITSSRRMTTALILKSALLTWIEMVILSSSEQEHTAWLKILENILVTVDATRMESSIGGQWRAAIGRCLQLLMDSTALPPPACLPLIARAILRLSLLPGSPVPNFARLLSKIVALLSRFEDGVLSPPYRIRRDSTTLAGSLHNSYTLHRDDEADPVQAWGEAVEAVWRVAMNSDSKDTTWDEMTPRALLWRSIIGEDNRLGEWMRKEVVYNLEHRSEAMEL